MEKNLTKRRASSLTLTLYSSSIRDSRDLAKKIQDYTDRDTFDAYEFIIKEADFSSAFDTDTNIVFIADTNSNPAINGLINLLEKKGQPYITIMAPEDDMENVMLKTINELKTALDLDFSVADFAQIKNHGICIEKIKAQLSIFNNGIPKVVLEKPALPNDGIFLLDKEATEQLASFFDSKKDNLKLKKFVPASGAATRMFKFLSEFLAQYDPENDTINYYMNKRKSTSLKVFLVGIEKFPFFNEVLQESRKHPLYGEWSRDMRYYNFIKIMLSKNQFDFANKPKAILPFHKYGDFTATPVYEHLKESVAYAGSQGNAHIHFTISEEHLDNFFDSIKEVKERIEYESGIKINFGFSYQQKQTDTLAVDGNNKPFREEDGSLLFRPGGHGALIANLNELKADIIFIKNIDNVSHNNIHTIALYKKALAGILIKLQEKVFSYLQKIENEALSCEEIEEIYLFTKQELCIDIPNDVSKYTPEHKINYITQLLNRPIRVCGMVKNEGEPGGGPFWVKSSNGRLSLQIVESSQIDLDNKSQEAIFSHSSHFNPVDLVCGLKNYKGEHFDLMQFIDPSTGFIVYKHKLGKELKSYELPGLWNGAMAGWTTVFVEVPLETFNPVKNVNDLLKPAHQPQ